MSILFEFYDICIDDPDYFIDLLTLTFAAVKFSNYLKFVNVIKNISK